MVIFSAVGTKGAAELNVAYTNSTEAAKAVIGAKTAKASTDDKVAAQGSIRPNCFVGAFLFFLLFFQKFKISICSSLFEKLPRQPLDFLQLFFEF